MTNFFKGKQPQNRFFMISWVVFVVLFAIIGFFHVINKTTDRANIIATDKCLKTIIYTSENECVQNNRDEKLCKLYFHQKDSNGTVKIGANYYSKFRNIQTEFYNKDECEKAYGKNCFKSSGNQASFEVKSDAIAVIVDKMGREIYNQDLLYRNGQFYIDHKNLLISRNPDSQCSLP